ncbi:MAG: crossover junction endodeoxyribonuclease RuvC [Dehalococcoidia bacterium]|jgi:crossover junction endodeoxyribonuclease RuvC|nr:MAG: crossover junction endodeoxyribonuclease RuvC [Dehalococcoidia bacterium]
MKILGIDPGTVSMGYGIVLSDASDDITMICYGALRRPASSPIGERLYFYYRELLKIISTNRPEAVAIERPFLAKNVRAALAIGRAQAVAILAAAGANLPSFEYTPAQIKQTVTDYGASSKEQIQEMVKLQLGLDTVPQPSDAADALACAICHLRMVRLGGIIASAEEDES